MEFTPGAYWLTIHYEGISAGPFEVVYGTRSEESEQAVHSFLNKETGIAVFLVPERLIGSDFEIEGPIGEVI